MTPAGKILVAVSGGPDSMALLHFLKKSGFNIRAFHLDHKIRGEEAVEDALFVKDYCRKNNIPVAMKAIDVPGYAMKNKLSLEEAGRNLRYKCLENIRRKIRASGIALAHHCDDNIETLLMRIKRGTGLKGMCGIPPVRGHVIRPFIDVWKKEILDYCKRNNIPYRTDRTNAENVHTRNRIRNVELPELEACEKNAKKKLFSLIKSSRRKYAGIIRQAEKKLSACTIDKYKSNGRSSIRLDAGRLSSAGKDLRPYIVRLAVEKIKGSLQNIEEVHVHDILRLKRGFICLPEGVYASVDDGKITVSNFKPEKKKIKSFKYILKIPGSVKIKETGQVISAVYSTMPENKKKIKNNEAYVDPEKISGTELIVRSCRAGDRFVPFGMKGSKKLHDYFIDNKVPPGERPGIPVVCDNKKILWIAGHRIDDRGRIDNRSNGAVKLTLS